MTKLSDHFARDNKMELANNISIVSLKDLPSYRQTLTDYVHNNW